MNGKKYLILILTILLLTGCTEKIDDYYEFINSDELNKITLSETDLTISTFSKYQEEVDEEKKKIINEMVTNPSNDTEKEAKKLYVLSLDELSRNNYGTKIIDEYIEKIKSVTKISEFVKLSTQIEKELDISILSNWTVTKDFKDNKKSMVYFNTVSYDYDFGTEYYTESDYLYYHALIKQYNIKLLMAYGYSENDAKQMVKKVDEYYKQIAIVSKKTSDYTDMTSYYNIISIDELNKIYSNVNITKYLNTNNLNVTEVSVADIDNYQKINELLTQNNLETLKSSVILKILQNYSLYTTTKLSDVITEFTIKITGEKEMPTIEDVSRDIVELYFQNEIDRLYSDKYLDNTKVNYINNLTNDIINIYKEEIKNNTWMKESTKEVALRKLNNIKITIGYDKNTFSLDELFKIDVDKSLVENIINLNITIKKFLINELENPSDLPGIPQTTVNAFYNLQDNSINYLSGATKLIDTSKSYYTNLGSVGMIIAHEITHAFDPNGAKFDEYGNMANWWGDSDYNAFNNIKKQVIDYYSKIEVTTGIYINGENTVGENIADLGAVETIIKLAESKNASKKDYTDMFTSFAKLWLEKDSLSYTQMLLLQDNHSPSKYRVNACLSSQNKFYEVYNIKENSSMYIEESERITIFK